MLEKNSNIESLDTSKLDNIIWDELIKDKEPNFITESNGDFSMTNMRHNIFVKENNLDDDFIKYKIEDSFITFLPVSIGYNDCTPILAKKSKNISCIDNKLIFKDIFVDGVKLGVDEGSVDGEWYKAGILSGKVPANVAIIDVRSPAEFANGHLKGAINLEAGKMSAADIAAKLPKGKVAIINCSTGGRAMEARTKLKDAKFDVSKVLYFDANIKCDNANKCEIKVNEPLG